MASKLFVVSIVMLAMFYAGGQLRHRHPYAPVSGRIAELGLQGGSGRPARVCISLSDVQPVHWMDYASFSMTGKVHVTITSFISERDVKTCYIRPLAYNIHPQLKGNTVSFDLDRPRYLVRLHQRRAAFFQHGVVAFRRRARGQRS